MSVFIVVSVVSVCFVCLLKRTFTGGELLSSSYLTGRKLGTHSQDCTLFKIVQLLLCVIQEKVIKVHIFIIAEVTAVHVSHYFKVK